MTNPIPALHFTSLEVQGLDETGSPLAVSDWLARGFTLEERLSEPHSLMLSLASPDKHLCVPALVGGRCLFQFGRGEFERQVHGVVIKADTLGRTADHLRVRLWVGPSVELLALSRRLRIFQGKTAVEVVAEVVEPLFEYYGGSLDTSLLEDIQFRVRDHCVQFDETDLAFVQRILAEDGIAFSFRHEGDAETMVLAHATACLHSASGEDEQAPRVTRLCSKDPELADEETIRGLQGSTRMRAARSEVSMWNWRASTPATVSAFEEPFAVEANAPASLARFGEVHEHEPYRPDEETEGGPPFMPVHWEAEANGHRARHEDALATGRGNVLGFSDGATFEVDHPTDHLDGKYVVLSVSHHAEFHDNDGVTQGQAASYENRFACQRYALADDENPYRFVPPRRAKPRAHGPMTAIVVGPEGEEIHTDEHGRIKVRMHWDREGAARGDHETSCWVPVGQMWAGPGYGSVFIPRVGMEAVVTFIGGDPDRPLCTGVVYNGANQPPYPLPESKTRSVIKTSSSPGGEGHNELSFEDAAGSEEVHLHAQKNLREVVKSCQTTSVGVDQNLSVGRHRTTTVKGHDKTTVKEWRNDFIEGDCSTVINGSEQTLVKCGGSKGTGGKGMAAKASTLHVEGERRVRAKKILMETSGEVATKVSIYPESVFIETPELFRIDVGGKAVFRITPTEATLTVDTIKLKSKTSTITMDGEAAGVVVQAADLVKLSQGEGGTSSLALDGDAKLKGSDIDVGAGGEVKVHASTASVEATKKATMGTPGTSFSAEPSAAKVNSAKIESVAIGVHEIKGALIKIN